MDATLKFGNAGHRNSTRGACQNTLTQPALRPVGDVPREPLARAEAWLLHWDLKPTSVKSMLALGNIARLISH